MTMRAIGHGREAVMVEALEGRRMLTVNFSPGHTLSVVGTKGDDHIVITRVDHQSRTMDISINGVVTRHTGNSVFRLFVNGGKGNDTVMIDCTMGVVMKNRAIMILGGVGNDHLSGGLGADSIDGQDGHDTLSGRDGNDSLHGSDGYDVISGGKGDDWIYGERGNDNLEGGAGRDWLDGGEQDDFLRGAVGDDECYGQAGDDSISGCEGNDRLHGGSGMDVIDGLTGSDNLSGEDGDDILSGNLGNKGPDLPGDRDSLFGDAGNDDYDSLDADDEMYCRVEDTGRNHCVPSFPGVKAIVDGRSFDELEIDPDVTPVLEPPADNCH